MQIHEKKFIIRIDILTRGFFFFYRTKRDFHISSPFYFFEYSRRRLPQQKSYFQSIQFFPSNQFSKVLHDGWKLQESQVHISGCQSNVHPCTRSSVFSEHAATRPAPSNACEQSLGFVYIPIPILTAPPSRLVWSRPPYSSRPVTAQIRPIPSRPVPTVRPVPVPFVPTRRRLVSPRLASPRFVSLRHGSPVPPVRSCGHVDRSLPCNEIRSPSVSP